MFKKSEFLLFAAAGVLGYLVDVTITYTTEPFAGPYLARIPAFLGAATATWVFNRSLTFKKTTKRHTNLWKEYVHYLSLMLFGLTVNYMVYAISITLLKDSHYGIFISVGLGSLAGMVVNYINSKRYLYHDPKDGLI